MEIQWRYPALPQSYLGQLILEKLSSCVVMWKLSRPTWVWSWSAITEAEHSKVWASSTFSGGSGSSTLADAPHVLSVWCGECQPISKSGSLRWPRRGPWRIIMDNMSYNPCKPVDSQQSCFSNRPTDPTLLRWPLLPSSIILFRASAWLELGWINNSNLDQPQIILRSICSKFPVCTCTIHSPCAFV